MSCSLYRWTEDCEQDSECVGDCDLCRKETMIDKYDEVGIPTGILEHTDTANMAMTGNATAKPMEECKYPRCEECAYYVAHYCTVPMVVSKQIYRFAQEKMREMDARLTELETLVTDEILRSK